MPSFKELEAIFTNTPADQAIMLEGIHGIGKSQWLKTRFEAAGYRFEPLFAGQMADAGDLIGLPSRKEVEVDGVVTVVTEHAVPKWWPLHMDEKVIIMLDEVNRGKPEIMQCLMDMILNRKLNGRDLPPETRIVGAINPLDDTGMYQVEELDPAFLDRWNRYALTPNSDEWIDWAVRDGDIHSLIVSFISRNSHELDPPGPNESEQGKVYPSRRSWERVSNFVKTIVGEDDRIDKDLLGNYMLGVVGVGATSAFIKHLKEVGSGINAMRILHSWDTDVQHEISKYNIQEVVHMNKQLSMCLDREVNTITDGSALGHTYGKNVQNYLDTIPPEAMADFFDHVSTSNNDGKVWPGALMNINDKLADRFVDIINGSEEEDENSDW
jgi:hypothetical protein